MKVHYHLNQLPPFLNGVITTGAFDGVHKGHQQIIARMQEIAVEIGGETIIITFHPPGEIKQLTSLNERIALLEKAGIDHLVVIPFDYQFSNLTASEYISAFLVKHFHPNTIIVGYDHHFGKGRMGNFEMLVNAGKEYNFKVEQINEQLIDNEIISSTQIRNYLSEKNITKANDLLGYAYFFDGFIVRGNQ
jgi:riboflavin kinase/FMN adenylyltransferase